ncbi:hypothetical protein OFC49_40635, partial [Escherichia coli]|nr:hypothetical protein [Escherichia coli]
MWRYQPATDIFKNDARHTDVMTGPGNTRNQDQVKIPDRFPVPDKTTSWSQASNLSVKFEIRLSQW